MTSITFRTPSSVELEMPSSSPSEALEAIFSSEDLMHCVVRYVSAALHIPIFHRFYSTTDC